MSATVEGHIWSNEGPRANGHEAGVEDGAIEIDEHVASNLDIRSVVNMDGPLDPRVLVKNRIIFILCCGRGREGLIAVRDPVAASALYCTLSVPSQLVLTLSNALQFLVASILQSCLVGSQPGCTVAERL